MAVIGIGSDLTMRVELSLLWLTVLVGCSEVATPPPSKENISTETLLQEIDVLSSKCRDGAGGEQETQKNCNLVELKSLEAEQRGWCWGARFQTNADRHWMRCSDAMKIDKQESWYSTRKSGRCVPTTIDEVRRHFEEIGSSNVDVFKDSQTSARVTATRRDGVEVEVRLTSSCETTAPLEKSTSTLQRAGRGPEASQTVEFAELKRLTAVGSDVSRRLRIASRINANNLGTDALCERVRDDGYCELADDRIYLDLTSLSATDRARLYDVRGRRGASICAIVHLQAGMVNAKAKLMTFHTGDCN